MKNIEKIAIDSILKSIEDKMGNDVVELTACKARFEEAKKNFQTLAGRLAQDARSLTGEILEELSEDGIAYLEKEVSGKLDIPFKAK